MTDSKTQSAPHFSIDLLATWFYLGKIPKAPGTFGTLGAIPLVLLFFTFGPMVYMGLTFVLVLASVFIAQAYENAKGTHDAKEIVIDEVVGFLITMTWLPATWQSFALGFLVFRFFDILKPFPVGYLDRKIQGGLGVVADDVMAGVLGSLCMQVIYTQTNWLGHQLVHAS
tara:strand:+ start:555 stop:1064 length:510 start_codon:yes stop_codon:yes gene_type:complete